MAIRLPLPLVGWLVALAGALAVPAVVGTPFYLHTATVALIFVTLAVAFDLVVGRIGALSLAQPVFYAFGAYTAGLMSIHLGTGIWLEMLAAGAGAALLSLAIGIPAFRLSLHAFAIGTLGFALTAHLVARNWIDVTGGPLCVSAVPPISIPLPGGGLTVSGATGNYYFALAIAASTVLIVALLARSRLGSAFIAVRDDPSLASARGLWPTRLRLTAFGMSAFFSALAGVFSAHFQRVVCPTQVELPITVLLLIMVFVGGRASLRGVVTAAIVFTVIPQLLRVADEWRLVIFASLLLVVVTQVPDGIEHVYRRLGTWIGDRRRGQADG